MNLAVLKHRDAPGAKLFDVLNHMFLGLFALVVTYPFYFCVMLAFNEGKDTELGGVYFLPRKFTLGNFSAILQHPQFWVAARNSVLRTVIGVVVSVFFTAMFGYVMSKRELVFRRFFLAMAVITMYFNGGLIPYFLLIKNLGLYDSFLVYIIPGMLGIFNSILFLSFFKTIPVSLEESALIDGANEFQIFLRVVLPVSAPVLATIALFNGVASWNSWFDANLLTKSDSLATLPLIMVKVLQTQQYMQDPPNEAARQALQQLRQHSTPMSVQLAIVCLTSFPIVVMYPLLQKYFVKGIMIGSIKG